MNKISNLIFGFFKHKKVMPNFTDMSQVIFFLAKTRPNSEQRKQAEKTIINFFSAKSCIKELVSYWSETKLSDNVEEHAKQIGNFIIQDGVCARKRDIRLFSNYCYLKETCSQIKRIIETRIALVFLDTKYNKHQIESLFTIEGLDPKLKKIIESNLIQ